MDIFEDSRLMHQKYGVNEWVKNNPDKLAQYLTFRLMFLQEELTETFTATNNLDAPEIVDGLIDLIVVAAGTLDAFEIDGKKAWKEVYKANMAKEVGVKPSRPNPLGLPDLIKPEGWQAPNHDDNVGILNECFGN